LEWTGFVWCEEASDSGHVSMVVILEVSFVFGCRGRCLGYFGVNRRVPLGTVLLDRWVVWVASR
jgi:hypothetical protein